MRCSNLPLAPGLRAGQEAGGIIAPYRPDHWWAQPHPHEGAGYPERPGRQRGSGLSNKRAGCTRGQAGRTTATNEEVKRGEATVTRNAESKGDG